MNQADLGDKTIMCEDVVFEAFGGGGGLLE
jgi:hypothetical protein